MKRISISIACFAFVVVGVIFGQVPVPFPGPTPISSTRPLSDASALLRHLYGKVVTYEEPVLVWPGDLTPMGKRDPGAKWALRPQPQSFIMPAETGVEPNLPLVIDKMLQAFHQATVGTRFQVLTSKWGYHIVPVQARDESGALVPVHSVLDSIITVPVEERTGGEHLRALAAAVQSAIGMRVVGDSGGGSPRSFDAMFRQTSGSKARPTFSWGASAIVARDALVDLFDRSETTLLWDVRCQPSAQRQDRFCVINVSMLGVVVTEPEGKRVIKVLRGDRCGKCVPPPTPRGTAQ